MVIDLKIKEAMEKIGIDSEVKLCRYMPGEDYISHMHHFSFNKFKKKDPQYLADLIDKYILSASSFKQFPSRQRSTRNTLLNTNFSCPEIMKCLLENTLNSKDNQSIIENLNGNKDIYISEVKQFLNSSIKHNKSIDPSWVSIYNSLIGLK